MSGVPEIARGESPVAGPPWAAYALLAASMALVGLYVGLSRQLVAVLPVFLLAGLRFGIAAIAMLHWLPPRAGDRPLSAHDRQLLFWESFLGNFGFSICMLYGVALTSALSAGVVMAGIPAAVAVLSRAWLGERIKPRVAASIVLAVAGIAILALSRHPGGTQAPTGAIVATLVSALPSPAAASWLGHALLVGAVFCEAAYVVIGKRLTANVSPRRISAIINLWGLCLVAPLALWQASTFDFGTLRPADWLLLVFYALAASMATVWLWMKGLQRVPAPQAGVFTVCLPIAAAAVGVLWLGEPTGAGHALALVLAVAGLLLATWPAAKPV